MAYILGGVTLPNPVNVTKDVIEVAQVNETLQGHTHKKTLWRKFKYTLEYNMEALSTIDNILALFTVDEVKSFESTETNFPVSPVDVLIDFGERNYPGVGKTYVASFKLILTEVR